MTIAYFSSPSCCLQNFSLKTNLPLIHYQQQWPFARHFLNVYATHTLAFSLFTGMFANTD
jgi:hypothetical protein